MTKRQGFIFFNYSGIYVFFDKILYICLILKNKQVMILSISIPLLTVIQPIVLFALVLVIFHFRFKFKSFSNIFLAAALGIVSVLVLLFFDFIAQLLNFDMLRGLKRIGFYSFAIIGFGAELGKFLILRYYFSVKESFKGPIDGVIYALMMATGFSLLALPLFAIGVFSQAVSSNFVYMYPIANLTFAVILGFFVGMGKYRKNRIVDSITGLVSASFFHGFFYFINLTNDTAILLLFGIGMSIIALLLFVKSMNTKELDANRTI